MRRLIVWGLCIVALVTGCAKTPTAEEKVQLQALRAELDVTKKEVASAEADNAMYAGGLLKAMVDVPPVTRQFMAGISQLRSLVS